MAKLNVTINATIIVAVDENDLVKLKEEFESGLFDNKEDYVDAFRDYAEKWAEEKITGLEGKEGITSIDLEEVTPDDEPEGEINFTE